MPVEHLGKTTKTAEKGHIWFRPKLPEAAPERPHNPHIWTRPKNKKAATSAGDATFLREWRPICITIVSQARPTSINRTNTAETGKTATPGRSQDPSAGGDPAPGAQWRPTAANPAHQGSGATLPRRGLTATGRQRRPSRASLRSARRAYFTPGIINQVHQQFYRSTKGDPFKSKQKSAKKRGRVSAKRSPFTSGKM